MLQFISVGFRHFTQQLRNHQHWSIMYGCGLVMVQIVSQFNCGQILMENAWHSYRPECQEVADFCYFRIIGIRYPYMSLKYDVNSFGAAAERDAKEPCPPPSWYRAPRPTMQKLKLGNESNTRYNSTLPDHCQLKTYLSSLNCLSCYSNRLLGVHS